MASRAVGSGILGSKALSSRSKNECSDNLWMTKGKGRGKTSAFDAF